MAWNKFLIIGLITFGLDSFSQVPKYWVFFKDKNNTAYSLSAPSAYLSAKSIQRRNNQNILIDSTDLPVNQTYVNQVNSAGGTVIYKSKWENAVLVSVPNSTVLTNINALPFVKSSGSVARVKKSDPEILEKISSAQYKIAASTGYNYGGSATQVQQIGVDCLHNLGYRGQNMTIAVIDAGFNNANINQVFDSLRNENRILGTYDFVAGSYSVYEDDAHGAMCLSTIVGNTPGQLIGTGPKSSVWLLRSEDVASEKLVEECYWVIAAEYADSVGADIISSSLGYNTGFTNPAQDHIYADLNGKTSVASIAATMASRKGIFVLNAAGNEGGNSWNYVGVPADADSICTVGSVNASGVHSSFSSVGPTADGRIKPEISTMGEGSYVCGPTGSFFSGNGTSFATPIAAGAVACLWQAHPDKTNMQILTAIKYTANKASNPDNQYGWGVPDFCAAHTYLTLNTGINNNKEESIKLFPNPTTQSFQFNANTNIVSVEVCDILGHSISVMDHTSGNQHTVTFKQDVPAGIYFVKINSSQGLIISKMIKQ